MEGWYVGIESLRLFNSALYTLYSDDKLMYKALYDIEAISYYQGRGIWRPTIRTGYIWFRNNYYWTVRARNRKVISRGAYVKLGTDILTSREENKNHAVGIHGVLSYGVEDYTFRVGNPYFGYKEVFYEQLTWATAIELRYVYTARIRDKVHCQLGGYVSIFEASDGLRATKAFLVLPIPSGYFYTSSIRSVNNRSIFFCSGKKISCLFTFL